MNLQVGCIYHVSVNLSARKFKYMLCVSVMPNYGLYINTNDHPWSDPHPINHRNGRAFPKHDSFIGCNQLMNFQPSEVQSRSGQIFPDEAKSLIEKISNSETLSRPEIDLVIGNLKKRFNIL